MEKFNKNNVSTYYYFSYGSNMLKERIQINDPNAVPYASAKLEVGLIHRAQEKIAKFGHKSFCSIS